MLPVALKMVIVPVELSVATAMLALTSPAISLRSETKGDGNALGKTVRKVRAEGVTPITLTATASAVVGTPASPDTLMIRDCPELMGLPLHWVLLPVRFDTLPGLVSQMRTGVGSALNSVPVPAE